MNGRPAEPTDRTWDDGRLAAAYRELAAGAAPASLVDATVGAVSLEQDRKPGWRGFGRPDLRGRRLALSLLSLGATVVLAGGLLLTLVNRGGTETGGSPIAVDTQGQFRLTFQMPRTTWRTGDSITGEATLSWLGSGTVGIGSSGMGPIGFLFDEIGGSRHMGGAWTDNLVGRELSPTKPFTSQITKSGAFVGEDPNAAFYRSFYTDPLVHLPPGDWTISAIASFGTGQLPVGSAASDGAQYMLRASVRVHVTG
jgi:hypothetical protein